MTLTKAIEAAEKAVNDLDFTTKSTVTISHELRMALAALPDKPMTEEQIWNIAADAWEENKSLLEIIRALKAADVLYVEEK